MINEGIFIRTESLFLYIQISDGWKRTNRIVGYTSIDEYQDNIIKSMINQRRQRVDRINHVDYCNAHTGPMF